MPDLGTKMPDSYKWIAMIDRLSGGDITKHDLIYDRNWRECLYLMSYWAERDKIDRMKAMASNG